VSIDTQNYSFPSPLLALVEQVRDGTTVRARLLLSDPQRHQLVNVSMTAVRSPRPVSRQGEAAEPWGDEVWHDVFPILSRLKIQFQAKYFTETRLLQRNVKIELISIPTPGPAPFQQNGAAPSYSASVFIGNGIFYMFTLMMSAELSLSDPSEW
jgi:staphylococcal nuclease domain-containing protein 1